MKFGSVCSGIEAASCAWESLGWEAQWFSEIEPFPSAVLKHHYPNVPNLGDMTKFKEWPDATINVLVGGTPCQSFSVAGLRKGLDDPRGNLMLTYLAAKYRPKWLVWENVPGVLSSNGGNDFASLLRGMGELGYGFAYRVLDAQYFGVAQRRRRVFVVGCLGDWRSAAAVLFERHSLCGNPAPSREKRKEVTSSIRVGIESSNNVARCLTARGAGAGNLDPETSNMIPTYGIPGNWIGRKPENGGNAVEPMNNISPCLTKTDVHGVATFSTPAIGNIVEDDLASTMTKNTGSGGETQNPAYVVQPYSIMPMNSGKDYKARETDIAQPLMAGSPVGGNQGGDFVVQPIAYAFDSLSSNSMKSSNPDSGVNQVNVSKTLDTSRGLDPSCNQGGIGVVQPIACDVADTLTVGANQMTRFIGDVVAIPISTQNALGRVNGRDDWPLGIFNDGDPAPTLSKSHGHAVATNIHAFPWQSALNPIGKQSSVSGTLVKNQTMAVSYEIIAPTLTSANNPSRSPQSSEVTNQVGAVYQASMAVRRLTAVECERLQGFPDNYTNIPWRGKSESPDGPRYKALGNSMAVPVMYWIGKRIQIIEDLG